ncbi:unnamed protein product, partial [marine sediment metagenome]
FSVKYLDLADFDYCRGERGTIAIRLYTVN